MGTPLTIAFALLAILGTLSVCCGVLSLLRQRVVAPRWWRTAPDWKAQGCFQLLAGAAAFLMSLPHFLGASENLRWNLMFLGAAASLAVRVVEDLHDSRYRRAVTRAPQQPQA